MPKPLILSDRTILISHDRRGLFWIRLSQDDFPPLSKDDIDLMSPPMDPEIIKKMQEKNTPEASAVTLLTLIIQEFARVRPPLAAAEVLVNQLLWLAHKLWAYRTTEISRAGDKTVVRQLAYRTLKGAVMNRHGSERGFILSRQDREIIHLAALVLGPADPIIAYWDVPPEPLMDRFSP